MKKLLTTLALLAAVGLVAYSWTSDSEAQVLGIGGTKVDVVMDPPQGFSRLNQASLSTSGYATLTHVSTAGYWFHEIGVRQIASCSNDVIFRLRPYSSTTDSSSIMCDANATYITVAFIGGATCLPTQSFPINCYQFSCERWSPNGGKNGLPDALNLVNTAVNAKFVMFGMEKTHN